MLEREVNARMRQMALFVERQANLPKLHYHKGEMGRKGRGIPTVQINTGNGKEIRERRKEDFTKMFFLDSPLNF
jgi:hypothetical protein